MPVTSAATANELLTTVLAEVGITPPADPWASSDQHVVQMKTLLQLVGEELCWLGDWEHLNRAHQFTTTGSDTGAYDLPSDYLTMIPQTGWERTNNTPLRGPMSPQEWTYLEGRDYVSHTIYATFRLSSGKFNILPQPVPAGLDINFEYRSRAWVEDPDDAANHIADIGKGGDIVLFDRTLATRYLKLKFQEAKGFDTTKAQDDVNMMFGLVQPADKSSPILSAGRGAGTFPYLDSMRNVRDTGFGNT